MVVWVLGTGGAGSRKEKKLMEGEDTRVGSFLGGGGTVEGGGETGGTRSAASKASLQKETPVRQKLGA